MPVHTGSVQDELLRLTGSANNPYETVTASGDGTGVYFGPDRAVQCRLVIAGAVTGTDETLDVVVQRCADAAGTSAETVGTFPQQTATHAVANGSLAESPTIVVRTTAALPWLRIVKTIGGSASPTFTNVAVLTDPIHDVVA